MIHYWGLDALCSGSGVIDICGDPGFFAAECLASGIHVTVIDPAFGSSGKTDHSTLDYINDQAHWNRVRRGAVPLRLIKEPFNDQFLQDADNAKLVRDASAVVSFYPDEATDIVVNVTGAQAKRTIVIPCNECVQYFPRHEPTFEGFVKHVMRKDQSNVWSCGQKAALQQDRLWGSPFCQVCLWRSPDEQSCHTSQW